MNTVSAFLGTWSVRWISGQRPWMSEGWTISIGTGEDGDSKPFLDGDYQICIGFTVRNTQGQVELSTSDQPDHEQPLVLLYDEGRLRWSGFYNANNGTVAEPLRIYLSLAQTQGPNGPTYACLYGTTAWGDPDQVGVIGADAAGSGRPGGG